MSPTVPAVELRPEGLYVPLADLYLDPAAPVARAFVSHAHADHIAAAAGGGVLFASRETAALVAARTGVSESVFRALEWGEPGGIDIGPGGCAVRGWIAPAGHMLGAAQLVLELPAGRLVYSGDYQSGPGLTHSAGAPVPCDALILESTFALPIFKFPDRASERARLVAWCKARTLEGDEPVVLAYAAGKAEEIVAALTQEGIAVVAHGAVFRMVRAYEALGVDLGAEKGLVRAYAEETKAKGKRARLDGVLVTPPRTHAHPLVKSRPRAKVALASGFALLDAPLEQHRADAGFVLSDHADHDDLLATAVATGARHVYSTHGDAKALAQFLARRGIAATALEAPSLDAKEREEGSP